MGRPYNARFGGRKDDNQNAIEKALRAQGFSLIDLSRLGGGVPDLLVSDKDSIWLVEIKNGKAKKLTPAQEKFFGAWAGKEIVRINSVLEAQHFYDFVRGLR